MTAAIAAMWLTACGGGGGGDPVAEAPPPAQGVNPPAPGQPPGQAPAPAPAAGTNWAATGPNDVWHSLSASSDGQVMLAGQAGTGAGENTASYLALSTDGGQTWAERDDLGSAIWIGTDVSGNGNRMAAVSLGGAMIVSVDRGATFVPVTVPAGLAFESVTISEDGSRVAAAAMGGPILVGTLASDGSVTFITPTTAAPTAGWRFIDSGNNGQTIVAVGEDPISYISRDGGANWEPLVVSVGSPATPVLDQNWYRVKVSEDGNTIVMVANQYGGASGNGIYVSKDGGQTFTRAFEGTNDYSSIAVSADGGVIAVTASPNGGSAGQVLLSTDGGATFAPLEITTDGAAVSETNWRAVAMSGDATRMGLAAGRFIGDAKGRVYVSSGSRP